MIKFKRGYKYQLFKTYSVTTPILGTRADLDFISLTPAGLLTIRKGYAWDGPSGPCFDTRTFMRSSLVHDAFYELLRYRAISHWRKHDVDLLLRQMCIEDGMSPIRAWWVYLGVDWFGGRNTKRQRPVYTAP